jgi:hypothetical protein
VSTIHSTRHYKNETNKNTKLYTFINDSIDMAVSSSNILTFIVILFAQQLSLGKLNEGECHSVINS